MYIFNIQLDPSVFVIILSLQFPDSGPVYSTNLKDFRYSRNSDLILQNAVPGLCFYTQFCDKHGRVQWALRAQICAFATAISRPGSTEPPDLTN